MTIDPRRLCQTSLMLDGRCIHIRLEFADPEAAEFVHREMLKEREDLEMVFEIHEPSQ